MNSQRRSRSGKGRPKYCLGQVTLVLAASKHTSAIHAGAVCIECEPSSGALEYHYVEDEMICVPVPSWADPSGFKTYPSSVFFRGFAQMLRDPRLPEDVKDSVLLQMVAYLLYSPTAPLLKYLPSKLCAWIWREVEARAAETGQLAETVLVHAVERAASLVDLNSSEDCSLERAFLRQVGKHVTEDFLGPDWRERGDLKRAHRLKFLKAAFQETLVSDAETTDEAETKDETRFLVELVESHLSSLPRRERELCEAFRRAEGDVERAAEDLRSQGWTNNRIYVTRHRLRARLEKLRMECGQM